MPANQCLDRPWSGLNRLAGQLTQPAVSSWAPVRPVHWWVDLTALMAAAPIAVSTGLVLRWLGLWLLALVVVWPRPWQSVRRTAIDQAGSPSDTAPTTRSLPARVGLPGSAAAFGHIGRCGCAPTHLEPPARLLRGGGMHCGIGFERCPCSANFSPLAASATVPPDRTESAERTAGRACCWRCRSCLSSTSSCGG